MKYSKINLIPNQTDIAKVRISEIKTRLVETIYTDAEKDGIYKKITKEI